MGVQGVAVAELIVRTAGLDLGQVNDYTAMAVLEQRNYPSDFLGPQYPKVVCRALRRWQLGTSYVDIIEDVLAVPVDVLVVDFTGIGRPFVDMLRTRARRIGYVGRIRPVVIAASNARLKMKGEERGSHWIVPKIDIVSSIVTLQQQKLLVLPGAPETKVLLSELQNFQMKYTHAANMQFGARNGKNDDLVLAFGLACWYVKRFGQRRFAVVC